MNFVQVRGDRRLLSVVSTAIALCLAALLAFSSRAEAAETIFWDNYNGSPDSISFANVDGTGGGVLTNFGAEPLSNPEGMALDVAGGRIFVAGTGNGEHGQILYANIDGSGGGVLNTGAAPLEDPLGVAIDPATGTIYWANGGNESSDPGSIAWAKLDGSGGGLVNTTGATVEKPYKMALDAVHGRLYWQNTTGPTGNSISYADLNGTGSGNLTITGTSPISADGLAVDPAAGRLYWVNSNEFEGISYTGLDGGPGGDLVSTGVFNGPYGIAFDPSIGRFYWGNYDNGTKAANAIGVQDLAGPGGGITIGTAEVNGPQDPVVLKAPVAGGAPAVARTSSRSELSCSPGTWPSYPSSYVYAEPRGYAYQWTKNGAAIAGATSATLAATAPGSYACTVAATNQAGATTQTSAAVRVKAAKLKLTTRKKARTKSGKVVEFKLKAVNQGDLRTGKAKVCVKLPKSAKRALQAPKCKSLGKLKGRAKKSVTLKVKVKASAAGSYKVKFQVRGASGKAAKSKIIVE